MRVFQSSRKKVAAVLGMVLALSVGLSACGGEDGGDGDTKKITVGIAVANTFDYLPAYAGVDLGVWSDEGIEVTVQSFAGDAKLQQAVAAGQIDFGIGTAAAAFPAVEAGQDIKVLAAISNTVRLFGVVTDPSITSPEDLKGKTLGVTGPNSVTDVLVRLLARSIGGDDEITRQPLGPYDAQLNALTGGQIDGFLWTLDGLTRTEQAGAGKTLLMMNDVIADFLYSTIYAPSSVVEEDPELVENFVDGWFVAQNRLKEDEDYAVALFEEKMQTPPEIGKQVWAIAKDSLTSDGSIDDAAFQALVDALVDVGALKDADVATAATDTSFLPANTD